MNKTIPFLAFLIFVLAAQPGPKKDPPWFSKISTKLTEEEKEWSVSEMGIDPADFFISKSLGELGREKAFEALLKTNIFEEELVGAGAKRPAQYKAFQILIQQPDAKEAFLDLLQRGRLPGQLYALCGLYLLDAPAFKEQVAHFVKSKEKVWYFYGCILHQREVARALPRILNGELPKAFVADLKRKKIPGR